MPGNTMEQGKFKGSRTSRKKIRWILHSNHVLNFRHEVDSEYSTFLKPSIHFPPYTRFHTIRNTFFISRGTRRIDMLSLEQRPRVKLHKKTYSPSKESSARRKRKKRSPTVKRDGKLWWTCPKKTNLQKIPRNRWSYRIKRIGVLPPPTLCSSRERSVASFFRHCGNPSWRELNEENEKVFASRNSIGPKGRNTGPAKPRKIECAPQRVAVRPFSHFTHSAIPPFLSFSLSLARALSLTTLHSQSFQREKSSESFVASCAQFSLFSRARVKRSGNGQVDCTHWVLGLVLIKKPFGNLDVWLGNLTGLLRHFVAGAAPVWGLEL